MKSGQHVGARVRWHTTDRIVTGANSKVITLTLVLIRVVLGDEWAEKMKWNEPGRRESDMRRLYGNRRGMQDRISCALHRLNFF